VAYLSETEASALGCIILFHAVVVRGVWVGAMLLISYICDQLLLLLLLLFLFLFCLLVVLVLLVLLPACA
jgi:hypothetical protein